MADLPGRPVVSAGFLTPDRDGQIRVLLTCDCGTPTDLTAEIPGTGTGETAYTCDGCGTDHWFTVTAKEDSVAGT